MSEGVGRTDVVAGPFATRSEAEELEQKVQAVLDAGGAYEGGEIVGLRLPEWAKGVRVEGTKVEGSDNEQFALVATEDAR